MYIYIEISETRYTADVCESIPCTQVILVDERSSGSFVVKDNDKCDFHISSYESSWGMLENPKHSLPPNTTCRYHFQAKPNEIVWLAFVKYYAATSDPVVAAAVSAGGDASNSECNVKLMIWNGKRSGLQAGTAGGSAKGELGTAKEVRDLVRYLYEEKLVALFFSSSFSSYKKYSISGDDV